MNQIPQKNPRETVITYGLVDFKKLPDFRGIDIIKLIKEHNITLNFVGDTILVSGDELVAAVKKENEALERANKECAEKILHFCFRHPFKGVWIMLFMWFKELNWHYDRP